MAAEQSQHVTLTALQSAEAAKITKITLELQNAGLEKVIAVPQMVMCGDQSSGKSSVLEALTGIPFPHDSGMCTRFATEAVLICSGKESTTVEIVPHPKREAHVAKRLSNFKGELKSLSELPAIIEKASEEMGLNSSESGSFGEEKLRITITGTELPDITLVDLPGLIHSPGTNQSMEDVATCKKLLNDYIEQERTIILAVFSAKNDFGTQAIFSEVKRVDPNFTRTLGIITKPDSTHPGSKSEKLWIKAAKNQEHRFQLGWHTLKNQCEEDREAEPDFLSRGSWAQIEYKHRGIVQLRNRLSTILHRHLLTELPKVRIEIQKQLFVTGDDIKKLGASRATLEEQRRFLSIAEDKARDLIRAAINNQINFDHDFFAVRKQSSGPASDHNSNRLRSATHDLNMLFLHAISTRGRKYELVALKRNRDESHKPRTPASTPGYSPGSSTLGSILTPTSTSPQSTFDNRDDQTDIEPSLIHTPISREDAIAWVDKKYQHIRGNEMPGTTNPTLATQLFHEQSGRWERIARAHIQNVRNLSLKFLRRVFEHLTTEDITDNLLAYKVIPAYNARVGAATAELEKILRDKDHEAVPYSHYLKNKAERNIDKKARDRLHKFLLHERESFRAQGQYLTPGAIDGALQTFEPRGDGVAGPALDTMLVYYNSYLKTFIDPVAMHVIERHLIQGLHNILSEPRSIAELDDREIAKLAKEPAYITERRADLQQTKQLLEDALNKYEAITI